MNRMTMDEVQRLQGSTLIGSDGSKIGKISDVYIDADTEQPEWGLVSTGMFGSRESFVPMAEASMSGKDVEVPYTKDQVKDAPNAEPDGELSQDEEAALYRHYGLSYSESASDSGLPTGGSRTETTKTDSTVGYDTSGAETDGAMTRSEERLRVGVQKTPSQSVRLRKYIVTENVSQTVPVTKERVRVEREPITQANMGSAMAGPELSEEEHEVVLTEERPVVSKETVPVERIRVDKDTVTENVEVTESVRKEVIEVDDETKRRR